MTNAPPSEQFLRVLREHDGQAGNGQLRDLLGMSDQAYAELRDQLAAQGLIVKGRGRGGSVALARDMSATTASTPAPAPPPRQSDLLQSMPPPA